jgi:proteasome accessory factor C
VTSARTARRLSRILAMVPWVIGHPGATVSEVCERFDYSRAELVRDLNLVFVCGLPGYGPGDLMEAYVDGDEVVVDMADYFAAPLRLTSTETLMLLAAGMALVSSGTAPEALETAIGKLQRALMPDEGVLAVELPAEPENVALLSGFAARGEVVEIEYTSIAKGETTIRQVEPWGVHSAMGNWYLRAFCRLAGDERVFRLDRIRRLQPTGEHFAPVDHDAADIGYSPGVDDVTALIRLSPAASWVAEYYPVEVVSDENGAQVVRFSAGDASVAARLLVRLGGTAALLEGEEVAQAIRDLRTRILGRYGAAS